MQAETVSRRAVTALVLALGLTASPARAQDLTLPARATGSVGGTALAAEIRGLALAPREERLYAEVARGNVPSWWRMLVPVEMTRRFEGRDVTVKFWVSPDYLVVGSDEDWFLTPLSPQTAQRIANLTGSSLPTPPMVDATWRAATVHFSPSPIRPSAAMITMPVFEDHNYTVRFQRAADPAPLGALVAGHKKDVVLSARLDTLPGRVAIYGWHRLNGTPIQPLNTGHTDWHVDYSHGIRLVRRIIMVDGVEHDMLDVLRDPQRAALLSDEGAIREPRYSLSTARWPR